MPSVGRNQYPHEPGPERLLILRLRRSTTYISGLWRHGGVTRPFFMPVSKIFGVARHRDEIILPPTKPFWRFDAKVLKPPPCTARANDAPNGRARAIKQGTSHVQSGRFQAELSRCRQPRGAGDERFRIFRLRRRDAAAAVSLHYDAAGTIGAAAGAGRTIR